MSSISFSTKRLAKLVGLFAASILLPTGCGLLQGARIDDLIVWCFISLVCFFCAVCYIEYERLHMVSVMGSSDDFSMFAFIYLLGLAGACIASFFPVYTAPVMAVSVLCSGTFPDRKGTALAVYFAILTAVFSSSGQESYTGAAYVLLALAGVFLLEFCLQGDRIWTSMVVVSVSVVIPVCSAYLEGHALRPKVLLFTLAGSAVTILVLQLVPRIRKRIETSEEISLNTIMNPHYHLQQAIERYSSVDFDHAKRVSEVASKIASELGADEKLSLAGGFYYRIGKLEGEPFVENGVRIAQQNFFPVRLIAILEEYNGINRLPSSMESAIVQISDMIVTKFDLLDKDTFSAGWNRDIVIYQTMNEKSAEGLYDHCGLSMNQFLKIRELLVNEEELVL